MTVKITDKVVNYIGFGLFMVIVQLMSIFQYGNYDDLAIRFLSLAYIIVVSGLHVYRYPEYENFFDEDDDDDDTGTPIQEPDMDSWVYHPKELLAHKC